MTIDELDRLAAEKVMGYTNLKEDHIYGLCNGLVQNWQPTRNIAHAWQCLEKTFGVTCGNIFLRYNSGPANNEWVCTIDTEHGRWEATETEAPIAIVCACLAAVGGGLSHLAG